MKKIITEEEYNNIIGRLKSIDQEYQDFEKTGLANSFEDLLIKIHRDNFKIDEEINQSVNLFFSNLYIENDDIKAKLEATIQFLIADIESRELNEEIKEPVEVISISTHFPEFQVLYSTIKDKIERKKANVFLRKNIEMILEEESDLQNQKKQYEKQQKTLKMKAFLSKFINN